MKPEELLSVLHTANRLQDTTRLTALRAAIRRETEAKIEKGE